VLAASASRSTLSASGIERVWTSMILRRPARSGEAPGAQQRRVEHVRTVRRGEHDHRLRAFEAVHFGQDLVECLLALVVAAADRDRPLA